MHRTSLLSLALLLAACGDKDGDDTGATDDTGVSDDTGDVQGDDPPALSADVDLVEGPVGGELIVTVTVDDEDPGSVTLEATLGDTGLATGGFDGTTWTGTGAARGLSSLTITATDSAGQTDTLELPLEVYVQRDWATPLLLQGSTNAVFGLDMAADADGNTYLGGYMQPGVYWGAAMAADSTGNPAWFQVYENSQDQIGRGIGYDAQNDVAVYISQDRAGAYYDATVRGLNASGQQWSVTFDIVENGNTLPYYVDARDGVAIVAGPFEDNTSGVKGAFGQLIDTADGSLIGSPMFFTAHTTAANSIGSVHLTDDGNVLVAGWAQVDLETGDAINHYNGFVALYEPGEAQPLWFHYWAEGDDVIPRHAIELADGTIAVAGETRVSLNGDDIQGEVDAMLHTFDADGSLLWTLQHGSANHDRFYRVTEGHDGALYVNTTYDYVTDGSQGWLEVSRVSADGDVEWTTGLPSSKSSRARGIAFSGRDVIVTGIANGDLPEAQLSHMGGWDAFAVVLDTEGNLR